MARSLVVEREAARVMADISKAAVEADEPLVRIGGCVLPAWQQRRIERRLSEGVQHVGDQQLLMLLFVIEAEFDQRRGLGRQIAQQPCQSGINSGAKGAHHVGTGPGEQATHGAGMPGADRLVVGIEQEAGIRVKHLISGKEGREDEFLKKPSRMGAMPLRRAGVGHGLDTLVLWRQRGGQVFRMIADSATSGGRVKRCQRQAGIVHERSPDRTAASLGRPRPVTGRSRNCHHEPPR